VFVEEPDTVLTRTFAGRCPAVALEVGPVGDPRGLTRVLDYLERLLELEAVPRSSVAELALFRSLARVHVRGGVSFRFEGDADGGDAELALTGGVEAVNFHELASGTPFGTTRREVADVLEVLDVRHRDVTGEFLARRGTEVVLNRPVVPAMYTTDPYVVRQDCLCYFMERLTSG